MPETKIVETGTYELNVKMKALGWKATLNIEREIRMILQNCAILGLLDEFVMTRTVEYREEAN